MNKTAFRGESLILSIREKSKIYVAIFLIVDSSYRLL